VPEADIPHLIKSKNGERFLALAGYLMPPRQRGGAYERSSAGLATTRFHVWRVFHIQQRHRVVRALKVGVLATVTAATDVNGPSQMLLGMLMAHFLLVDCPSRAGSLRPIAPVAR
jgi:hypothetical protein